MKTKIYASAFAFAFCALQACQSPEKHGTKTDSVAVDTSTNENMVTDTTGINRGAKLSVFINQAALDGMAEIELSKIAQEKASNEKVKEFAKTIVKDHVKIAERLKDLADEKHLTLPSALPQQQLAHFAEMQKMQGEEFDKHYIGMMIKDHIKTLDLFKSATTSGDTPVQNFAIKSLRTLENHYKTATDLNDRLNGKVHSGY